MCFSTIDTCYGSRNFNLYAPCYLKIVISYLILTIWLWLQTWLWLHTWFWLFDCDYKLDCDYILDFDYLIVVTNLIVITYLILSIWLWLHTWLWQLDCDYILVCGNLIVITNLIGIINLIVTAVRWYLKLLTVSGGCPPQLETVESTFCYDLINHKQFPDILACRCLLTLFIMSLHLFASAVCFVFII